MKFYVHWLLKNLQDDVQFHLPEVTFQHPEIKALITLRAQKNRSNKSSSPNTITCRANNLISTDAFLINRSTLILNPLLCKSLNFSLLHLWLQNHCDISMHIGKNPSGVKFNSPLRQTWNFLWHTPYHYTQVKG